jgi:hypothetical protein
VCPIQVHFLLFIWISININCLQFPISLCQVAVLGTPVRHSKYTEDFSFDTKLYIRCMSELWAQVYPSLELLKRHWNYLIP